MIQISVIAPCFNEENNIGYLIERVDAVFKEHAIAGELILINDGSTDATQEVIDRCMREHDWVIGVTHQTNKGITEAWASGLHAARGGYVVTIDADLQYDPHDIARMYETIQSGNYDLVQGWREDYRDASFLRKCLSRGLSVTLNILFIMNIRDIKSGYVMYKRDVLADILEERTHFLTFQHFFIIAAIKKGYRFFQIPISFNPRLHGESFIANPFSFSCQVLYDMPVALMRYSFFHRNKKKVGS